MRRVSGGNIQAIARGGIPEQGGGRAGQSIGVAVYVVRVAVEMHVDFALSLEETEIVADAALIGSALDEILLNAVEFSGRDAVRVTVSMTHGDGGVVLLVSDDGPGVRHEPISG